MGWEGCPDFIEVVGIEDDVEGAEVVVAEGELEVGAKGPGGFVVGAGAEGEAEGGAEAEEGFAVEGLVVDAVDGGFVAEAAGVAEVAEVEAADEVEEEGFLLEEGMAEAGVEGHDGEAVVAPVDGVVADGFGGGAVLFGVEGDFEEGTVLSVAGVVEETGGPVELAEGFEEEAFAVEVVDGGIGVGQVEVADLSTRTDEELGFEWGGCSKQEGGAQE